MNPPISILCPTYGRTVLLNEMLESFINLKYDGDYELIILNDLVEQVLVFDHPKVKIINTKTRYPTLGDKRNTLISLASYEWLRWWDDDDIYLSHCLSVVGDMLFGHKCIREAYEAQLGVNGDLIIRKSRPMGTLFMTKEAVKSIGGFESFHMHQDVDLNKRLVFSGMFKNRKPIYGIPSTIWRLGLSHFHITDMGEVRVPNELIVPLTRDEALKRIKDGTEPTGIVYLKPEWKCDYQALVLEAWNKATIKV